jgi:hypothetical protein
MYSKGADNLTMANNTIVTSAGLAEPSRGIRIGDTDFISNNNVIKNNIIITYDAVAISIVTNGDLVSTNNIIYSTDATPFIIDGVDKTAAEWRAAGYDTDESLYVLPELFEVADGVFMPTHASIANGAGLSGVSESLLQSFSLEHMIPWAQSGKPIGAVAVPQGGIQ